MIEKVKTCTKCKKEKLLSKYHRDKKGLFGCGQECCECVSIRTKIYYKNNSEEIKNNVSIYRKANDGKIKECQKKYRDANRKKRRIDGKAYREANKEKMKEYLKSYRASHKAERNKRHRERCKTDPKYKLNGIISTTIGNSLKNGKDGKSWTSMVGYTTTDLMEHLEKQFKEGMTWGNYGKWHLDHKIPISVFNFTKPEHTDFKKCWALKNLQPLWAKENMSKKATLTKHFQPSLLL